MNTKYKGDLLFIGKRIAGARKKLGLTQEALAHQLGFASKHISAIERGISGLTVGSLMELSKVLEVSTDYILFGEEKTDGLLAKKINTLSASQKMYLEEMVNTFVKCCTDEECFPVRSTVELNGPTDTEVKE